MSSQKKGSEQSNKLQTVNKVTNKMLLEMTRVCDEQWKLDNEAVEKVVICGRVDNLCFEKRKVVLEVDDCSGKVEVSYYPRED